MDKPLGYKVHILEYSRDCQAYTNIGWVIKREKRPGMLTVKVFLMLPLLQEAHLPAFFGVDGDSLLPLDKVAR